MPEVVAWTIHTGPFPIIAPSYDGEVWLWRISDGEHYSAVVVKFDSAISRASELSAAVRETLRTRGRLDVERCLRWYEPPREISYARVDGTPEYWGGRRTPPADDVSSAPRALP